MNFIFSKLFGSNEQRRITNSDYQIRPTAAVALYCAMWTYTATKLSGYSVAEETMPATMNYSFGYGSYSSL